MKRTKAGWLTLMAVALAACGDSSPASPHELSQPTASEELVSGSAVDEAASMTDRPDFRTDVANRDRVCDVSDRTVSAGRELAGAAMELDRYIQAHYPETTSARAAPVFTESSRALYEALVGSASCRRVVERFLATAHAGHTLGRALIAEELLRRDDRLAALVKSTAREFVHLLELLRHDLSNQTTDTRVTDQP